MSQRDLTAEIAESAEGLMRFRGLAATCVLLAWSGSADAGDVIFLKDGRTLTKPERNYGAPKGELLAFLLALSKAGRLLRPHRFTWRTDNKPLSAVYAGGGTNDSRLVERICVALGFDLSTVHVAGKVCSADAFSRLPAS